MAFGKFSTKTADHKPSSLKVEVVSDADRDARYMSVTQTEIRPLFPQPQSETRSDPPTREFVPLQDVRQAGRTRLSARLRRMFVIFSVTAVVSAGLLLVLFPHGRMVNQAAPGSTTSFSVSAVDPAAQADTSAKVNAASDARPAGLDKPVSNKGPVLNLGNRTFSYAQEPRISGEPSYLSSSGGMSPNSVRNPQSGLRPATSGDGRFISRGGLEWQGGWERDNPAGNIQRGQNYLKYLRGQFNSGMDKSLAARETGVSAVSPRLPPAPAGDMPILKYPK